MRFRLWCAYTNTRFPQRGGCSSTREWSMTKMRSRLCQCCSLASVDPDSSPVSVGVRTDRLWFLLSAAVFILRIDELILREWICFAPVGVWPAAPSSGNDEETFLHCSGFTSLSALPLMHAEVLFHMHLENTTSPLVLSRRRWAFVSRLWERFSFSLGDSPLSSRCCKPASLYADGRLCLAGIRVFGAYCCPQRWVCQGRMPSKSAGEHYISHYLRTIGHFLLAAGQRGWSLAAKLMERRAVWEGLASKRGKRFQNW